MLRKEINQVNGMGVLQIRVVRKAPGEVICEQRLSGPLNPRAQHVACVQWKRVVLGSEKGVEGPDAPLRDIACKPLPPPFTLHLVQLTVYVTWSLQQSSLSHPIPVSLTSSNPSTRASASSGLADGQSHLRSSFAHQLSGSPFSSVMKHILLWSHLCPSGIPSLAAPPPHLSLLPSGHAGLLGHVFPHSHSFRLKWSSSP